MSNRSAKFISAIFASILAGANFAAVAENSAKTTDDCLSSPKGAIPAGHHWYYRTEHPSKRQCWYSREESDRSARAAPQESISSPASQAPSSLAAAIPVPPPLSPTVRKSIADARAELIPSQMRIEQDPVTAEPRASAAAVAASFQNNQRAAAPDAPSSSVASRWPDSSDPSQAGNPRLASAEPAASPQSDAEPPPQPTVTPAALAAANSSLEKQSGSTQMLFLVMAGALALAGITASLIQRFGSARATQPEIRGDRRAIWDDSHTERSSPSMFADEDTPIWHANAPRDVPRDPGAPDDAERRVTEMLARLARSAQT